MKSSDLHGGTIGRVFDIQKFSLHDGPGIRTVVFLKGCPLRCAWCCNPGSQKLAILPVRDPDDPTVFTPDSTDRTIDDVTQICLQDEPFYAESGGGVTLSGGEVLVQHSFALALTDRLHSHGVHVALETAGHAPHNVFRRVVDAVDYVIIDVKHHDPELHRRWTGVDNALILANLRQALDQKRDSLLIRIPVIPGVNDSVDDAASFARLLVPMGVTTVQLLPFHQLGERKYDLLGWDYSMASAAPLHAEDLDAFRDATAREGLTAWV